MSSKFKKLLLSIIIILAGILISNNVKADVVGGIVTKDDMNNQHYINGSHRFQPTKEDNGILFCIQPGAAFKSDMTLSEYSTYKDISESTHQATKPSLPWTGDKTYMTYTRQSYTAPLDVAYIFATANERNINIPQNMFMARSVWGSSICGELAQGGTWLNTEAQAYVTWHNTFLDGNGNFKKKNGNYKDVSFTVEEQGGKAKVAVDQENQKYTVGKFKVEYPGIDGGVGTSSSTKKDNDININQTIEDLQELIKIANKITKIPTEHEKCNMKTEGREWSDFTKAIDSAQTYLDSRIGDILISDLADEANVDRTLKEDEFKDIYEKTVNKYNNIIKKQKEVKVKLGGTYATLWETKSIEVKDKNDKGKYVTTDIAVTFKSEINLVSIEQKTTEKDTEYLFSYISKVQIKCYSDVEGKQEISGKTLTNDVEHAEFDIIGTNGAIVENTPVMVDNNTKVAYVNNIPKNKEQFYVRFDHSKVQGAKSVKVFVTITYLSGCEANICVYEGSAYTWTWANKSKQTAWKCTIEHVHESTCVTADKWEYWYEKSATGPSARQRLMFIYMNGGKVDAKKNWKSIELNKADNTVPIDITMDIGGYAFLDMKDDVKGNDNNGTREDNEGLKDVEVWLYKHGDDNKVEKIASTNEKGYYQFSELDAMKNYYVRFVYNGMIYETIPEYNINENYNTDAWKVTSKAQEVENGKFDERTLFNNIFAEIGSYPDNYSIVGHQMFGSDLGNYNRTYTQMEIADTFKQLSSKIAEKYKNTEYVNKSYTDVVKEVCHELAGNDTEAKRKLQFAADCRISAYSTRNKAKINDTYGGDNPTKDIYPVYSKFVLDGKGVDTEDGKIFTLGNETYKPIYNGQYYINCGVEPRQAFKLALRKDAYNAKVSINGKTETYWYNFLFSKDPFTITITRENYEKAMNDFYLTGNKNQQVFDTEKYDRNNIKTEYNLYTRKEEVYNGDGNVDNYNALGGSVDSATRLENGYKINNSYEEDLEKLKQTLDIRVTYKIEVSNQSKVLGQVTEVVDYFDRNYEMVEAYAEHTKDGVTMDRLPVDINTQSMYATRGNNQFIDASKYDTRYLTIPETEGKRLLGDNGKIYYYVTLRLRDPEKNTPNAALLKAYMNSGEKKLRLINLAEINGYKTYLEDRTLPAGLVDIDSNPGNLDLRGRAFNEASLDSTPHIGEDDTSRAPTIVCDKTESRTLEGQVFEDVTNASLNTGDIRNGDGTLTTNDKGINGVIVELVELTNEGMKVRSTTTTTQIQRDGQTIDGWYGFIDFLPGNYTIRFTYGSNNDTAMKNDSYYASGRNDKSYNGQDFQSTIYSLGNGNKENKIDTDLVNRLNELYNSKNNQETSVTLSEKELIDNHKDGNYWYEKDVDIRSSDARDDEARKQEVINYSRKEYQKDDKDTEIVSHKAEVFNAYETTNNLPVHTKNNGELEGLVKELERRTFRYAYTPEMNIEVEYATNEIGDAAQRNSTEQYKHQIRNVDFGVVERPRSELVIDQDVAHIKVTAADGVTVLFDTDTATNNLQWINKGKTATPTNTYYNGKEIDEYDKNELLNIIMDEELIDGATLEVTYNIKVTNNGETDGESTTRAKNIINYVSNNLTFDEAENQYWEVVKLSDIQNDKNSTWIHQKFSIKTGYADEDTFLDLSNQQVILKAKESSPLTSALKPGKSTPTVQLKLKKKMSTEGANDNLTYTNMTEIVEIENTVGRYDHGATPGNQDINYEPQEHDTSGASYYDRQENYPDTDKPYGNTPQDGRIIVTPPTGSTHIYYWIGIVGTLLLAVGIYLIKKFVLDNRK